MPYPVHLVFAFACLTACSTALPQGPGAAATRADTVPVSTPQPVLPIVENEAGKSEDDYEPRLAADACTLDGYWEFFETFVYSSQVRARHTLASARPAARDFRIALVDNQWMLKDRSSGTYRPIEIVQQREGDTFAVTWRRLDSADAAIKPLTYRFVFADGCWQLAEQTGA